MVAELKQSIADAKLHSTNVDTELLEKHLAKLRGVLSVVQQDLKENGLEQAAEMSQSVLDEVTENLDAERAYLSVELRKAQAYVDELEGKSREKDIVDSLKETVMLRTEEISAGLRKAEATLKVRWTDTVSKTPISPQKEKEQPALHCLPWLPVLIWLSETTSLLYLIWWSSRRKASSRTLRTRT